MSKRSRNKRQINKALKTVRAETIQKIAATGEEVLQELKKEKWRYRALMALWLVMPGKGRK